MIGKGITVRQGKDVCLIGTGVLTAIALDAAKLLDVQGISARVESFHTVKPLDEARLAEVFTAYPVVATIEEHSKIGGLGGAVAEWLAAQDNVRGKLLSFGTDDVFMHEIGSTKYARNKFGLTAENIASTVALRLKSRRAA